MKFVRCIVCLVLAAFALSGADARFPRGGGGFTPFVSPLKIGGGGWNTGLAIANDGTRFSRTDTYGGFKYNSTTGLWQQFVTQSQMPVASFGYYPTTGTSQVQQGTGGVYEIDVVPSDSSKVYMIFGAQLFGSTNGGSTWVLKNLPSQPSDGLQALDPNGPYRQNGRKMAVDPNNYLHLLVGTSQDGMYETTDGGNTFASVTAVPTSLIEGGGYPGYNIAFDPSSAHNCGTGSIQTCTVYAFAYTGAAQMYVTTNGGVSWTPTTLGPTTMDRMIVAPTGGTVWATDSTNGSGGSGGNLWKYVSGTGWTEVTAAGSNCHSIAVDPNSTTHAICGTPAGQIITSNDTGSTWASLGYSVTGTDVPWLPNTGGILYMANGDTVFDKSVNGLVLLGMGLGVFTSSPPVASGSNVWTSLNAGIEQLVAIDGIAPNGIPVVGNEDRSTFKLTSPNTYPSVQNNTYQNVLALAVTYGLDYAASNTNFMAALITVSAGSAGNNSGTSTDGGSTWTPFSSYYQTVPASALGGCSGSTPVTITVPNTTNLTSWTFNTSTGASGSIVRVIGGGVGQSFSANSFWAITVNSSTSITLLGSACSNFATSGTSISYQIVQETQPRSNWNGGFNVTGAANNGSGLIRLTFANTGQSLYGGQMLCMSGVVGTTEANGCFPITVVNANSNQADLNGSTFTHAYTSGGVATYDIPTGGEIAVSTALNMVIVPSNNSFPNCTADGGQTWTELKVPTTTLGQETGWSYALWTFRHTFVADRVTANTFYGYNYNQGVYKMTNCGTPTVVSGSQLNSGISGYTTNTPTANLFPSASVGSTLKSVPGYAGHLFLAPGSIGNPGSLHPATTNLFRSTDGGQNWFPIANVAEPIKISCDGAIGPGSDYPTCYMVGWVGNSYGTWRTTATAAQWASCTGSGASQVCGTGVTWTQVAGYPNGSMDNPASVIADGVVWNKWYEGFGGSGWAYGQQNYLLKRDLDPASNDNDPMWTNKAA